MFWGDVVNIALQVTIRTFLYASIPTPRRCRNAKKAS